MFNCYFKTPGWRVTSRGLLMSPKFQKRSALKFAGRIIPGAKRRGGIPRKQRSNLITGYGVPRLSNF